MSYLEARESHLSLAEIQQKVSALFGKKAWNVSLGIGTFITMEFGNPQEKKHFQERATFSSKISTILSSQKNLEFIHGE